MHRHKNKYIRLYKKVWNKIGDGTPLSYDCGVLCNKKCCCGTDSDGMQLFPFEEFMYQDIQSIESNRFNLKGNSRFNKKDSDRLSFVDSCRSTVNGNNRLSLTDSNQFDSKSNDQFSFKNRHNSIAKDNNRFGLKGSNRLNLEDNNRLSLTDSVQFDSKDSNWFNIIDSNISLLNGYKIKYLTCSGHCPREYRPLSCRIFPVIPYINELGRMEFRLDLRSLRTCPIAYKSDEYVIDESFIENLYLAFPPLLKDKQVVEFIEILSCQYDELAEIIEKFTPSRL